MYLDIIAPVYVVEVVDNNYMPNKDKNKLLVRAII